MSPKEKADELVNEFCHSAISDKHQIGWAKMNSVKCVKQLIKHNADPPDNNVLGYWELVIEEINLI